ncbi:transport between ER and Golgi ATPase protein [Sorochytrium milnesiophthora]
MSRLLRVVKCPSEGLALTNCLIVSPQDFDAHCRYVVLNGTHIFTVRADPLVQPGTIGTGNMQRKWAALSLGQEVTVQPYDPFATNATISAYSLTLEACYISFFEFRERGQIFTVGQFLAFEFHGTNFILTLTDAEVMTVDALNSYLRGDIKESEVPREKAQYGMLIAQSQILFTKAPDANLKLAGDAKKTAMNPIIQPSFRFEDLGIGGLDLEFGAIFRRAFASRIFPPSIVEKLGIQHVKGILLHGPPGTGKTLMARQIAKMLNAREPVIVNGPEVLNKFVGQSEENIRKLFAAAEQEYKEKGEESGLHIIIFDELDAICKQRGSKNDGTGVGDSIVNQLLSKMDGVEQLNNILLIGMTNRKDMIDEALLRPGTSWRRLEVHLEISLPDEKGRLQIIKIHTKKMLDNNMLAPDVDLNELALLTKNFSGAEIAGLVKSATSFAFNRHVKVGDVGGVQTDPGEVQVTREDFLHALDEVQAAFGASESELQQCVQNGIISLPTTKTILDKGALFIKQVKESTRTPSISVLLYGPPGSGKTALAATMAMSSDFPFIKLISPESMVGFNEVAKANQITKIFTDSYKSPLSVIVVDNLERLLNWVPIGPVFSNIVLQTLLVLLKKPPPQGKKLLVLCTTSQRSILDRMDMTEAFDSEIHVSSIQDLQSVATVTSELKLFPDSEGIRRCFEMLQDSRIEERGISIPVKRLLMNIEMARQDEHVMEKYVEVLLEEARRK